MRMADKHFFSNARVICKLNLKAFVVVYIKYLKLN